MKGIESSSNGIYGVGFEGTLEQLGAWPWVGVLQENSRCIDPDSDVWETGDMVFAHSRTAHTGWEIARNIPQPENGTIQRKL